MVPETNMPVRFYLSPNREDGSASILVSEPLDYETTPTFSLRVRAQNVAAVPLAAFTTVYVNVTGRSPGSPGSLRRAGATVTERETPVTQQPRNPATPSLGTTLFSDLVVGECGSRAQTHSFFTFLISSSRNTPKSSEAGIKVMGSSLFDFSV